MCLNGRVLLGRCCVSRQPTEHHFRSQYSAMVNSGIRLHTHTFLPEDAFLLQCHA